MLVSSLTALLDRVENSGNELSSLEERWYSQISRASLTSKEQVQTKLRFVSHNHSTSLLASFLFAFF